MANPIQNLMLGNNQDQNKNLILNYSSFNHQEIKSMMDNYFNQHLKIIFTKRECNYKMIALFEQNITCSDIYHYLLNYYEHIVPPPRLKINRTNSTLEYLPYSSIKFREWLRNKNYIWDIYFDQQNLPHSCFVLDIEDNCHNHSIYNNNNNNNNNLPGINILSGINPTNNQNNQTNQSNQLNQTNQNNQTNQLNQTNQPNQNNQTNQSNQTNQLNQTNQINQVNQNNLLTHPIY